MRLLAGIVLVLALAPPAAAETVARRTPTVGPVFAGDSIMWGEEPRNGALRIVMGSPGREPLLMHRIRPATARKTVRVFMTIPAALDASADAYAALMLTGTVTQQESDSVTTTTTAGAFGGPLAGPPELLSGSMPPRGDSGCEGGAVRRPEAVAVDGTRIAVGESVGECDAFPRPSFVTIHDGGERMSIPVAGRGHIRHVELNGRYLTWIHEANVDSLVVLDLQTGAPVAQVTQRDLDARSIDDAALADDGTVVMTFGGLRDRRGVRLGVLSPGTPGVRLLDRHARSRGVAVAGGRVLYERELGGPRFASDLIVRPLADGAPRRIDFFDGRRERIGEIDLGEARATWVVQRVRVTPNVLRPVGPARIVVRDL